MSEKHYYDSEHGSILHSSTPSGAALKSYRHDLRHTLNKTQRKQAHVVHIRRRHDKKEFKYRVHEIHDPVDIEKDGIMIHFEYKTKVKSMNRKSRSRHSKSRSHHSKSRSRHSTSRSRHSKSRSRHSKSRSRHSKSRSRHSTSRSRR
jgi:hypothetical protein